MLAVVLASTGAFAANGEVIKSVSPENKAVVGCTSTVTSTSTTNADGSTTRTTKTSISCDTPGELAAAHQLMKALGMGV